MQCWRAKRFRTIPVELTRHELSCNSLQPRVWNSKSVARAAQEKKQGAGPERERTALRAAMRCSRSGSK